MQVTTSVIDNHERLARCELFAGLDPDQLARVAALFSERVVLQGTVMAREGDLADEVFVVHDGSLEVVREHAGGREQRVATLDGGSVIGEMAWLDRAPRAATVRALTPAVLARVSTERLRAVVLSDPGIERVLLRNVADHLSRRVHTAHVTTVEALSQNLESEQTRSLMGRFIIYMCFVMVSYAFAFKLALELLPAGATPSLVTFPLTLLWAGAAWQLMRSSGRPLAFFGVSAHDWRSTMPETLAWTLAGCAAATLLKLVLIATNEAFADQRLFSLAGLLEPGTTPGQLQGVLILAMLYAVTAPLQELTVRAGLQTAFHHLLVGRSASTQSIVLSNAMFAAAHVHLSLPFALVAFFVGLLWGDLFARQRQLVGVSVCHLLVGWFAFLVVGFEPWY